MPLDQERQPSIVDFCVREISRRKFGQPSGSAASRELDADATPGANLACSESVLSERLRATRRCSNEVR